MTDVAIECPHCRRSFKLNETLAAPLVEETRRRFEREFAEKEDALAASRTQLAEAQSAADTLRKSNERERNELEAQREKLAEQIAEQVAAQRSAIEREAGIKAARKFEEQLAQRDVEQRELEAAMKQQAEKLGEAQQAQKEALRKQRELDEKLRELDLLAEKKAGELIAGQVEKARHEAEEGQRLKLLDKEKTIADLQVKLQEAIRKA